MIVERIEYIVNTTTRFIVDLWVRQWPLLLLTLWAVQDVWLSLELTDTADVVTNTAIAITSFAGTVACLKIFRFERSFWMYAQVFIGVGATFFFTNVELTQLTSILHQDSFDEIWVYRIVAVSYTHLGQPGKPRFSQAVMRSAARLTYDQVKACLLDKDTAALADLKAQERGEEVLAMLDKAFALYAVLRDVRRQRGTLDFDLPEAECRLDDLGRVAWLGHRLRHDAHRLIEEFMIAANEAVARHLRDADIPFLYRIHPEPDPERLESLFDTLEATGFENLPPRPTAASMQGVLAAVQGTPQEFLVNRLCLRAMPLSLIHIYMCIRDSAHRTRGVFNDGGNRRHAHHRPDRRPGRDGHQLNGLPCQPASCGFSHQLSPAYGGF